MPRTTNLSLDKIASRENISYAIYQATRGKRQKRDVIALQNSFDQTIARISQSLQAGRLPVGSFDQFTIHDPKQRVIHAAPLVDRIAHHALMRFAGPRLERALLPSVYACRVNKGVHRAVLKAQRNRRGGSQNQLPDLFHVSGQTQGPRHVSKQRRQSPLAQHLPKGRPLY